MVGLIPEFVKKERRKKNYGQFDHKGGPPLKSQRKELLMSVYEKCKQRALRLGADESGKISLDCWSGSIPCGGCGTMVGARSSCIDV